MYDHLNLNKLKEVINDVFNSNKINGIDLPQAFHPSPLGHKMFNDALIAEMQKLADSINTKLIFKNPNTEVITEVSLEEWNKLSYETKEKLRDYCISNNLPEYRPGLYEQLDTTNIWKTYQTTRGVTITMQHNPILDNQLAPGNAWTPIEHNSYIAGIDPYKINNK